MATSSKRRRRRARSRRGQGLVEYALIIAGVAMIGAVGMALFAWFIIGRWMSDRQQVAHATPAWIIPVVGLLDDAGHRATSVATADEARRALRHQPFEVMFTDLRIGRQSGIELLGEAKEKWPRMLVVMVTGNATVDSAVKYWNVNVS